MACPSPCNDPSHRQEPGSMHPPLGSINGRPVHDIVGYRHAHALHALPYEETVPGAQFLVRWADERGADTTHGGQLADWVTGEACEKDAVWAMTTFIQHSRQLAVNLDVGYISAIEDILVDAIVNQDSTHYVVRIAGISPLFKWELLHPLHSKSIGKTFQVYCDRHNMRYVIVPKHQLKYIYPKAVEQWEAVGCRGQALHLHRIKDAIKYHFEGIRLRHINNGTGAIVHVAANTPRIRQFSMIKRGNCSKPTGIISHNALRYPPYYIVHSAEPTLIDENGARHGVVEIHEETPDQSTPKENPAQEKERPDVQAAIEDVPVYTIVNVDSTPYLTSEKDQAEPVQPTQKEIEIQTIRESVETEPAPDTPLKTCAIAAVAVNHEDPSQWLREMYPKRKEECANEQVVIARPPSPPTEQQQQPEEVMDPVVDSSAALRYIHRLELGYFQNCQI